MTALAERPTYAGTRRFADRPLTVTRSRHRLAEPAFLVVLASLADVVRGACRAAASRVGLASAARMTARTISTPIVAGAFFLGFGTLIVVEAHEVPADRSPRMLVVMPSPTPYPSGWTYEAR